MKGWVGYAVGSGFVKKKDWKARFAVVDSDNGILQLMKTGDVLAEEITIQGHIADMVPGNAGEFQFCLLPFGEEAPNPTATPPRSKLMKLGSFISSRTPTSESKKKNATHRFLVEDEEVMINWINFLAKVSAVHSVGDDVSSLEPRQPTPRASTPREEEQVERKNEPSQEELEEIARQKALAEQRERERRERRAAILIQSTWRMIQAQRVYTTLLREFQAARLLQTWVRMRKENLKYRAVVKKHRYRQRVQGELLSTEESYHNDLTLLIKIFMEPLQERKLLQPPQVNAIFANISSIMSLHEYLLQQLRPLYEGGMPVSPYICLGEIFTFLLSQFKVYVEYINNYDHAAALLAKMKENNSKLRTFLQGTMEITELNSRGVESFLIMPVQRLPRIEMLLKDLVKNTERDHPDYAHLTEASAGISEITAFINERKREEENSNRIAEVQRKMGKKSATNILQPHRKWLKEGSVQVRRFDKQKMKQKTAILFNDMLLCTTEKSQVAVKKGLHSTIRYDEMDTFLLDGTAEVEVTVLGDEVGVYLRTKSGTCTLYTQDEAEAREWVQAITAAINAFKLPRGPSRLQAIHS